MQNQKKAYIYALIAIFFWSTVSSAFKIALEYMDFIQLLFYSSVIALIIYFVVLVYQKRVNEIFTFTTKDILYSALLGLLNPFCYYMVLLKAYSILPAQLAQPLNYTWPIMLVLLSAVFLKQKLNLKSLIAIVISFLGVFFISSRGNLTNYSITEPFGVALATGSSIIWASFWIFNVKDKREEVIKLFFSFLFGTFYIFISILMFSSFKIISLKGILAVSYVGFFEMGISFLLWLKAMQLTSRNDKISNLVYLSPFLALIFIHFLLGETIFYTTIIGLCLIIVGIFVQQIKR